MHNKVMLWSIDAMIYDFIIHLWGLEFLSSEEV